MDDDKPSYKELAQQKDESAVEKSSVSTVDRAISMLSSKEGGSDDSPDALTRKAVAFGLWTMVIFFTVFFTWGALAPLSSAAVAPGRVILEGNKKSINHFEGGIIEQILVREGATVSKGQPLIALDGTSAKAREDLLRGQYVDAQAARARLIAERDGAKEINYPQELLDLRDSNAVVAQNLESQSRLFVSRRNALEGQKRVLVQRVRQFEEEIGGLRVQITSANDQIKLLQEEISTVRTLVEKGLANKPRLLSLERGAASLRGQRGENQSRIARAQQSISETQIQIMNVETQFANGVVEELKETETQLSNLNEQLRAASGVMGRIEITSPIDGIITDMAVLTVGSSIAPNERLMDIIPLNDNLIVETKVSPQDIDIVHTGLLAQVRLTAYKLRNVPALDGEVVNVSASRFDDPRTGESYFKARIEIKAEQIAALDNVALTPGMPADALIITGKRSFLNYLFSPITDSFNKAFREQ